MAAAACVCARGRLARPKTQEGGVDVTARETPGVIELGDDGAHERLRQSECPGLVLQMIREKRERQLTRAIPRVGPLETGSTEDTQVEARVEWSAVNRHFGTIQAAASLIDLHGAASILGPSGRELGLDRFLQLLHAEGLAKQA